MPRPCVVDSVVLGNIGLDRFGPFDDVWTADERPRGTACLVPVLLELHGRTRRNPIHRLLRRGVSLRVGKDSLARAIWCGRFA
jgi:hypothetical protein